MKEDGNKKHYSVDRDGNADSINVYLIVYGIYAGEVLQTYRDNYKLNSDHMTNI